MSKETIENPFKAFDVINMSPDKAAMETTATPIGGVESTKSKAVDLDKKHLDEQAALEDEQRLADEAKRIEDEKTKLAEDKKAKKVTKEEKAEDKDENEVDEDTDKSDGKEEKSVYRVFAEQLSEKGVIYFDPEKFKDGEEGLEEAVASTIQANIDNFYENLPDDFKQMYDYHNAGGDLRQFSKIYYEGVDWTKQSIETEDSQKSVVREYLKLTGETDEDIEDMITEWVDLGSIEKHAKKGLTKLQANQESQKAQLVALQKEAAIKQAEKIRQDWEMFKNELYSKDTIQGFKLTDKAKNEIWEYITVPDKKTGLTGLQKHNQENKEAQFLYAYLAKNNWNLDSLKKTVKTELSSNLSAKLKNIKDSDTRTKLTTRSKDNNLEPEAKNNFSSFRTIL